MCFSAASSFISSGVLVGIGVATLMRNQSTPHRMLAAIPLLFGIQQAAEGVVWLTVGRDLMVHDVAVHLFLSIALVIWPVWVPYSLQSIEKEATRKRQLLVLSYFGAAVSAYSIQVLVNWGPEAQIAGNSIRYDYIKSHISLSPVFYLLCYCMPTMGSFFLSTATLMRTTGSAMVAALVVTMFYRNSCLTSVWCFFAAVLSMLILFSVMAEQRVKSNR